MQSHLYQTTQSHSDEEIKQAIASASEALLTRSLEFECSIENMYIM
jgi:hypothetical protein